MPKSPTPVVSPSPLPTRPSLDGQSDVAPSTRSKSTSYGVEGEPHVVRLSIPALSEYVRVVRLAVTGVASRMPFAYDEVEDIKLAVSEACNNAILHAAPDVSTALPMVTIELTLHADRLEVAVSDEGHLAPPGLPAPRRQTADAHLREAQLPENGLGLLLIQTLMDEVSHHTSPVEQTTVRMTKRLRH